MKFKFLFLLFCIVAMTGHSQQTDVAIVPSSWIGKVKMGDSNPEVVFNIFKDSIGHLSVNLGVPSKGIQGIPLSAVRMKQDSIIIKSDAAQLTYKGLFEKDRKAISGIWIEPQLTSSLVLTPLTKAVDYTTIKKENTSSLPLQSESTHFNFYSEKGDIAVLDSLSATLESNYIRITEKMKTRFDSKIDVFIYPDVTSFHKAIYAPDAPDWVVGAASKNELKMVSPLKPGSAHTYESLMQSIVHEFVHTLVLNIRKQGVVGLPNWLSEGYAYYEAGQLAASQRKTISTQLANKTMPSWNELEGATEYEFGHMNGYPMSAMIVEFLVKSFGFDALKQFIIEPENLESIFKVSKEELEALWLQDLAKS